MTLINYCKYINTIQLEYILNLLPKQYQKLNVNIYLLSDKKQIYRYIKHRGIFKIIGKIVFHIPYDINGTCTDYNDIFIFTYQFNMSNTNEYRELAILNCIQTFIHELRHQYQKEYMTDKYKQYVINKRYQRNIKHDDRWEEIDAKIFSSEFMKNNFDKLINIIKKKE